MYCNITSIFVVTHETSTGSWGATTTTPITKRTFAISYSVSEAEKNDESDLLDEMHQFQDTFGNAVNLAMDQGHEKPRSSAFLECAGKSAALVEAGGKLFFCRALLAPFPARARVWDTNPLGTTHSQTLSPKP